MVTSVLKRNIIGVSAAINACGKGYNWEKALMLLELIWSNSFEANYVGLSSAVAACAEGKQWNKALMLVH